jgi:hypothetical protein
MDKRTISCRQQLHGRRPRLDHTDEPSCLTGVCSVRTHLVHASATVFQGAGVQCRLCGLHDAWQVRQWLKRSQPTATAENTERDRICSS